MKTKKIIALFTIALLLFSGIKFTLANENLTYKKAQELAEQYIKKFSKDELWNWQNPTIVKWNYFYTDKENQASYVEFKVSCDNTKDCGFIMVNIDWDDVAIPFASTSGTTASEILLQKLGENDIFSKNSKKMDYKFYYFSPFDQYIENKENKIAISLNPSDDIDTKIQTFELNEKLKVKQDWLVKNNPRISLESLSKEILFTDIDKMQINKSSVENKKIEFKNELYNKLEILKKEAIEFKKSEEFTQKKLEIKNLIWKVENTEYIWKALELNNKWWISNKVESIWNHVYVDWTTINQSTCVWKTPCYDQFRTTYYTNGRLQSCLSWCGPTAVWIIFWYYSNNWRYDLMTSQNPWWTLSSSVRSDIEDIWDMIWTYCNTWWEGATPANKIQLAKQHAKNVWYSNTNSIYRYPESLDNIYWKVVTEINANRPIILITENSASAHVIVAFWYYVDIGGSDYVVRVNMWWWYNPITSGSSVYWSNMDINLNSVYISASESHIVSWYNTFEIKY